MAQLNQTQKDILQHLTQSEDGQHKLEAMIGAHTFLYTGRIGEEPDNISFRFAGSKTVNWCSIRLNDLDCYDIEFCRMRGFDVQKVAKYDDLFAEDLRETFEEVTGLSLQL